MTCSPLSTGRLRVSVMVLFAAFTLALSTLMGVLSGLVLVTVKPALPVRAAGTRRVARLGLGTRWGPLTLRGVIHRASEGQRDGLVCRIHAGAVDGDGGAAGAGAGHGKAGVARQGGR